MFKVVNKGSMEGLVVYSIFKTIYFIGFLGGIGVWVRVKLGG